MIPILSILIFFPLAAAVGLLLIPTSRSSVIRAVSLIIAGIEFLISLPLFFLYDETSAQMQFLERHLWVPGWGIEYHVGVDGISVLLIVMTTFLTLLSVPASWSSVEGHLREFMATLFFLLAGMIGVFASLDLFLFYVFWEVMLAPMYLIIGVWGGKNRIYAAVKFFIYTMAGSVLMLVGIMVLYFEHHAATGTYTFNLLELYKFHLRSDLQPWLFLSFFLAFAVKVPMFPVHTWLPDAHVEAPTVGSVILAGVLLKMGTYGIIRFAFPLFPVGMTMFAYPIFILSLIGIIYGALVAMVQTDIKKLVAYSSVSHLGFCVMGITAMTQKGVEGGVLQMINHGLSTGALFLLIGMLYERRHTRLISEYGGIAKVVPIYTVVFMIVTFSSIGFPGLNGFVGEFLILLGTFEVQPWIAAIAATGVILSAVYMLWMVQRVFFGVIHKEENRQLKDMNLREILYIAPIIVFIFWIGVYPEPFLAKMRVSVHGIIENICGIGGCQ